MGTPSALVFVFGGTRWPGFLHARRILT